MMYKRSEGLTPSLSHEAKFFGLVPDIKQNESST